MIEKYKFTLEPFWQTLYSVTTDPIRKDISVIATTLVRTAALAAALMMTGTLHAQAPKSNKKPAAAGKSMASESFADRSTANNQFWWPERLDLSPLRLNGAESDPYAQDLNYAEEFSKLDLKAVKEDIA